jgi:serine/threonine protein kinase
MPGNVRRRRTGSPRGRRVGSHGVTTTINRYRSRSDKPSVVSLWTDGVFGHLPVAEGQDPDDEKAEDAQLCQRYIFGTGPERQPPGTVPGGRISFTHQDGRESTYILGDKLGSGTFGIVYAARSEGQNVAVKLSALDNAKKVPLNMLLFMKAVRPPPKEGTRLNRYIIREVAALRALDQVPQVVGMLDWAVADDVVRSFIVLERAMCSLAQLQDRRLFKTFSSNGIRIICDLIIGMKAVNELMVWHRDLKSDNILIFEDAVGRYTAKIGDFGLSRIGPFELLRRRSCVGTQGYQAPEAIMMEHEDTSPVLKGMHVMYGQESEVYSLGMILLEMMIGYKQSMRLIGSEDKEDSIAQLFKVASMYGLKALAGVLKNSKKKKIDVRPVMLRALKQLDGRSVVSNQSIDRSVETIRVLLPNTVQNLVRYQAAKLVAGMLFPDPELRLTYDQAFTQVYSFARYTVRPDRGDCTGMELMEELSTKKNTLHGRGHAHPIRRPMPYEGEPRYTPLLATLGDTTSTYGRVRPALFIATNLYRRYLQDDIFQGQLPGTNDRLMLAACMQLASTLMDYVPVRSGSLLFICETGCLETDIQYLARRIFDAVDGMVCTHTSLTYAHSFASEVGPMGPTVVWNGRLEAILWVLETTSLAFTRSMRELATIALDAYHGRTLSHTTTTILSAHVQKYSASIVVKKAALHRFGDGSSGSLVGRPVMPSSRRQTRSIMNNIMH